MKNTQTSSLLLLLFTLASCAGVKSVNVEKQSLFKNKKTGAIEPTFFWSHYDATQRGSMYKVAPDGTVTVLAENPPDAAVESSLKIVAQAQKTGGVSAQGSLEAVRSIAQLGQRTAAVNILRDALYRLAELCNNAGGMNQPMNADVKAVIMQTLNTCEKVSIEMAKETDANAKAAMMNDLKEIVKSLPEAERKAVNLDALLQKL